MEFNNRTLSKEHYELWSLNPITFWNKTYYFNDRLLNRPFLISQINYAKNHVSTLFEKEKFFADKASRVQSNAVVSLNYCSYENYEFCSTNHNKPWLVSIFTLNEKQDFKVIVQYRLKGFYNFSETEPLADLRSTLLDEYVQKLKEHPNIIGNFIFISRISSEQICIEVILLCLCEIEEFDLVNIMSSSKFIFLKIIQLGNKNKFLWHYLMYKEIYCRSNIFNDTIKMFSFLCKPEQKIVLSICNQFKHLPISQSLCKTQFIDLVSVIFIAYVSNYFSSIGVNVQFYKFVEFRHYNFWGFSEFLFILAWTSMLSFLREQVKWGFKIDVIYGSNRPMLESWPFGVLDFNLNFVQNKKF